MNRKWPARAGVATSWERALKIMAASMLGVALALNTGCSSPPDATPTPVVPVQSATAAVQTIADHIEGDAVLSPLAQAAITPKIAAPVKKFYVQRGAPVKAGQLLAVLENGDLAAAAVDSRGGYEQAQAAYTTATQVQVPEEYQKANLDAQQSKSALTLAQSVFDARTKLFHQGAVPGRDVDTAKASLIQAQTAYDIAAKHLSLVAQVSRTAELKNAQGQVTSAEGKLQGAQASLSYSEIRSPIKGVVTERALFAGEMASTGQPLITVMDTSSLLAKLHVSLVQAHSLRLGGAAEVTSSTFDTPAEGTLTLISPAVDPGSTTVEVWVKLNNAKGVLKVGTPVHVNITGRTVPDAVVVPTEAVQTDTSGAKSLMVIGADSVAHKRPVTTGIVDGAQTQITDGLHAGETIVNQGSYALEDGTKVSVQAPAGQTKGDAGPEKTGAEKTSPAKAERQ